MCLFVIQMYTLMKYLFTSFTHFKNWVIFTVEFWKFFVYFEHMCLSAIPITNIFSQFVPCLFILLIESFEEQVLKSDELVDWLFPLWIILLVSCSRNLYLTQVHKIYSYVCVYKFVVLSLGLWFVLSYFFNMMWHIDSLFFFLTWYPIASETFDENASLSPHCFCTYFENSRSSMCGYIPEFSILFCQYACQSLSQYLTVKQRCC